MSIWRMRIACRRLKATNTYSEYVIIICFSTATMVTRTLLNVTLYAHCLSSYSKILVLKMGISMFMCNDGTHWEDEVAFQTIIWVKMHCSGLKSAGMWHYKNGSQMFWQHHDPSNCEEALAQLCSITFHKTESTTVPLWEAEMLQFVGNLWFVIFDMWAR
jgi:hypothetical protein